MFFLAGNQQLWELFSLMNTTIAETPDYAKLTRTISHHFSDITIFTYQCTLSESGSHRR